MPQNELVKRLTKAGITATSDGLLRDYISRGKWSAALDSLNDSVDRRNKELEFLSTLSIELSTKIEEGTD